MHTVAMIIPGARGAAADQIRSVYARVLPSLVSCLPGLLNAEQEPLQGSGGPGPAGCCTLWFRSEQEAAAALSSREWVELIDETADLFDWDAAEFTFGDAHSPRPELVRP